MEFILETLPSATSSGITTGTLSSTPLGVALKVPHIVSSGIPPKFSFQITPGETSGTLPVILPSFFREFFKRSFRDFFRNSRLLKK